MARTAPRCPQPDKHFRTEVNKGSINMRFWTRHLNDEYQQGYRLMHVFEQDGNTVQVYEHHWHDHGFDTV
jgi:hypothetical protein